mmetsp:Transcript_14395/g.34851  ORF Transcript_14395/g.34851 Transcript_14395/m.34851 type:complete len:231 (-) Transcript_14395:426-1118(-)
MERPDPLLEGEECLVLHRVLLVPRDQVLEAHVHFQLVRRGRHVGQRHEAVSVQVEVREPLLGREAVVLEEASQQLRKLMETLWLLVDHLFHFHLRLLIDFFGVHFLDRFAPQATGLEHARGFVVIQNDLPLLAGDSGRLLVITREPLASALDAGHVGEEGVRDLIGDVELKRLDCLEVVRLRHHRLIPIPLVSAQLLETFHDRELVVLQCLAEKAGSSLDFLLLRGLHAA